MISLLSLLLLMHGTAGGAIEWAGFLNFGGDPRFSLVNTETGERSGWRQIGQSFAGYRIESHDPARNVLHLASPEGSIELSLRAASAATAERTDVGHLRARVAVDLGPGDGFITGGFASTDGKRLIVAVLPAAANSSEVEMTVRFIEISDAVAREFGFISLLTEEGETNRSQVRPREEIDDLFRRRLQEAEPSDVLSTPRMRVQSGHEATSSMPPFIDIRTSPTLKEDGGLHVDFDLKLSLGESARE